MPRRRRPSFFSFFAERARQGIPCAVALTVAWRESRFACSLSVHRSRTPCRHPRLLRSREAGDEAAQPLGEMGASRQTQPRKQRGVVDHLRASLFRQVEFRSPASSQTHFVAAVAPSPSIDEKPGSGNDKMTGDRIAWSHLARSSADPKTFQLNEIFSSNWQNFSFD